jgi:hypothetical protein
MLANYTESLYGKDMKASNPHAVALGSLGRGHPKTMSPAAIRQRQQAAKQPKRKRTAKAK